MSAQYLSEIEMAKAQRDYELKKATYDIEVNTRRAQADLAYQLQVSATPGGQPPTCESAGDRTERSPAPTLSYSDSDPHVLLPISDPTLPNEGNLKDQHISAEKQRKGQEVYDLQGWSCVWSRLCPV